MHAVVYKEVELWNSFSEKMARVFRPRTNPMYQQVAKHHYNLSRVRDLRSARLMLHCDLEVG